MSISRVHCASCDASLEGDFEVSALGRLSPEDQIFVTAFVRAHGSIKKMEKTFGISYPTVKNRLNSVVRLLDRTFRAPSDNKTILDQLAAGEITVEEALERMD